MSSSSRYAERCANWLRKESPCDIDLIQREIARFSSRLDQLQNSQSETQQIDDLLATLQLLEDHLASIQPQMPLSTNQEETAPSDPMTIDLSPLVDPSIKHEAIDDDTKAQRLNELLSHPGIQKGFRAKSNNHKCD
ncbi:MAG: hypothetical protein OXE99_05275 [Cellvibrionales bacterium]|nr:hypothetical protein [Cellvibrionales bacterium]